MLLPLNHVTSVSFNIYAYSDKTCYKSSHGHRKKKVVTFSGISLDCICVTPCTRASGALEVVVCIVKLGRHIAVVAEAEVKEQMF